MLHFSDAAVDLSVENRRLLRPGIFGDVLYFLACNVLYAIWCSMRPKITNVILLVVLQVEVLSQRTKSYFGRGKKISWECDKTEKFLEALTIFFFFNFFP